MTGKMPTVAENIKKVAIVDGVGQEQAQFLQMDQGELLVRIIEDICHAWRVKSPDDYSLQFTEPMVPHYITEKNRVEIQSGHVLKLTLSPAKKAQQIIDHLQNKQVKPKDKISSLQQLSEQTFDVTFAHEFINKSGMQLIITLIEDGVFNELTEGNAWILKAFVELMGHSIVSWDNLEPKFIKMIAKNVQVSNMSGSHASTLQASLEILESFVLNSTDKYAVVEQEVTPSSLLPFLQSSNTEIQKNAIALINALFLKADPPKRQKIADDLQTKHIRNVILDNVTKGMITIGAEMAHQLYVLQSLLFNLLEDRRMTPVDPSDQKSAQMIAELRKIFDQDPTSTPPLNRRHANTRDYKKLGFQNYNNPVEDFSHTPPGALSLDVMRYFAKIHTVEYTKLVLENSSRSDDHDLPFAQASIELTNLLCEILRVGDQPTDEGQSFHRMFFTHDKPFEEFYSICISLLNKTWRAMKATPQDLGKVLSVVREQITRVMACSPPNFEQFKNLLRQYTYTEITKLWETERAKKEEWESQALPILELRQQIQPEMMELIKQQRLNRLVEGTRFSQYHKGSRVKDKFWYCRLSPNHKALHYGDCEEHTTPSIDQLPFKLAVVDMRDLHTGKDCSELKDQKKKLSQAKLAFEIVTEPNITESRTFIAPTELDFQMWTDGISALLGKPMDSDKTKQDLDTLLSMEIKLRLLDTEGIKIPESPPPIPPDPPNYDFAYGV